MSKRQTIAEYAKKNELSYKQVRHRILKRRLSAKKVKGQWMIDDEGPETKKGSKLDALKMRKLQVETDYRAEQLQANRRRLFEEWSELFLDAYYESMQPVRKYFQDLQDEKINDLFEGCFKELKTRLAAVDEKLGMR